MGAPQAHQICPPQLLGWAEPSRTPHPAVRATYLLHARDAETAQGALLCFGRLRSVVVAPHQHGSGTGSEASTWLTNIRSR
eukprot:2227068-Prymnesium_polylepis.1